MDLSGIDNRNEGDSESQTLQFVANPIHMSKTPVEYKSPPPHLGEDTKEVLMRVLGVSPEEIDRLAEENVLGLRG